jgi:hypothetical protein
MLAAALAAAALQPQPRSLRTVGHWTAGCDNVRACRAVALVPASEDRDRYLLAVITREGEPMAQPSLRVASGNDLPAGPLTIRIDGKLAGRITREAALPFNRAFASMLANGRALTVHGGDGPPLAAASLRGIAAAFLHIDEQQRRLGTAGALIRRGPRPDATVPAPPPLPRIVQPRPTGGAPRALAAGAAARLIGPDNARCAHASGPVRPRAIRLDARHSVALVTHPCGNGAYNIFTSVFVVDETGRVRPAAFDAGTGMDPDGADPNMLVNADWDAKRRRLTGFAKGRGLGDCGTMQEYAWNGRDFRLAEQRDMGECRGSIDYITTWRAAVTTAR